VCLKSYHGLFLCAEADGQMNASRLLDLLMK
jgi:hypothetical protein